MNDILIDMPPTTTTTINGVPRQGGIAGTPAPAPRKRAKQAEPTWWSRVGDRIRTADSASWIMAVYYLAVIGAVLWGGTEAATGWLDLPAPMALFFVAVGELSSVAFAHTADKLLRDDERLLAAISGLLATGIAAAAVWLQWQGHQVMGKPIQAFFFGLLSALGFLSYVLRAVAKWLKKRRADGLRPGKAPSYGLEQWLAETRVTWTARRLAKNNPDLDRVSSLRAAEVHLGLRRFITTVLSLSVLNAKGKTDTHKMRALLTVHPINLVAEELGEVVDRTAFVRWLAGHLDPRVMLGAKAAPPVPANALPNEEQVLAATGRAAARAATSGRSRRGTITVPARSRQRTDEELVTEYRALRAQGLTKTEAALRMGYAQLRGLTKALDRAGYVDDD